MIPRQLLILSFLAAALSACSNEQQSAEPVVEQAPELPTLEGSSWQLEEMIVLGGHSFVPEDPADYTIAFRSDGRVTGKSDCNSFTAQWTEADSAVQVGDFKFTRSMCIPGSLHNYFSLYLRQVSDVARAETRLEFTTPTPDVRLRFQPQE